MTTSRDKRLTQDEDYSNKAMNSYLRVTHGQNVKYEVVGDKVLINNGSVVDKATLLKQSFDMQEDLISRPELNKVYGDRQKRVEQSERFSNPNLQEKSVNEIMQEQAQSAMKSNAGKRGFASQKQQQSSKTNLPSERA